MSTRRKLSANLLLTLLGLALLGQVAQAQSINWRNNLDAAQVEAGRTGKLVLLHFYTSSCGPCKKLERDVFSQPQIAAAMERDYIPVKLNADDAPAYANKFQITRVPSEVVLTPQGSIVQKLSCPLEPNAYGAQIVNVAQHYRQRSANRTASAQTPVNSAYAGLKIGQSNNAPTATTAPTVNKAPLAPAVTKNPYVTAAPPAVQQRPAGPQQPALPANAMPNSYGDRYAAVTAPKTPAVTQAPVVEVPVTPPMTPPIAAVPQAAAPPLAATAPPIVQTETHPAVTASPTAPPIAAKPPVVADVWPPQLPAGAPPLAFDGFCPVSLQQAQKWVRGNKTFGAIHRGRTYLFASDVQRQKFLAAPDSYSPVFQGNDPVKMLDENQEVAGSRQYGFEYRGAFYLFSSKETMARFASQPDRYSAGVRQAMNRMDAAAGGTLRR